MEPESKKPEVFTITIGRKTSSAAKKKPKKQLFVSMPLTALTNWIPPNGEVLVSREWAIAAGFDLKESLPPIEKAVDKDKGKPNVSTYNFDDNDDLP